MVDWSEQRRFARHPIQLPILHDAASPGSTEKKAGWTRNLSEGGACLELDEHVPVPSLLHLHLQTDHGAIEVDAQVVWEMEDRESGEGEAGVLHGVAFTHLSPEQLQALRGLLRSHGQDWRAGLRLPLDLPVTCEPEGATAGSQVLACSSREFTPEGCTTVIAGWRAPVGDRVKRTRTTPSWRRSRAWGG